MQTAITAMMTIHCTQSMKRQAPLVKLITNHTGTGEMMSTRIPGIL